MAKTRVTLNDSEKQQITDVRALSKLQAQRRLAVIGLNEIDKDIAEVRKRLGMETDEA